MNAFIESFATHQLLPPWLAKGGRTWNFVVRTNERNTSKYLAKYFNGAYPDRAPFLYEPMPGAQLGLLVAAQRPDVSSQYPGRPPGWDTIGYWEVFWSFPVYRYRITSDNLLVDRKVVWVQPFSFGDNASAVFSSREIWGTDMTMATITAQDNLPPGQLHLDVIIEGIKKFAPRSHSEQLAFVHVKADRPMAAPKNPRDLIESLRRNHPHLADFVMLLGASVEFAGQEGPKSAAPPSVELDNLKQFRDCHNMEEAIYRAIVASRTVHTEIADVFFYEGADVELDFMWSDSVKQMLHSLFETKGRTKPGPPPEHRGPSRRSAHGGLNIQSADWDMPRLTMPVEFGFSYISNVTFEVIDTIHTYGVAKRSGGGELPL